MSVHHKKLLSAYSPQMGSTTAEGCCVLCVRCHCLAHMLKIYDPIELKKDLNKRKYDARNKIPGIEEKVVDSYNGRSRVLRRGKISI